jgi:hypothetical protein
MDDPAARFQIWSQELVSVNTDIKFDKLQQTGEVPELQSLHCVVRAAGVLLRRFGVAAIPIFSPWGLPHFP